jgi:hypothetical protein
MLLGTNAFIYLKEYEEDKQFLTCPYCDTGRDYRCFYNSAGVAYIVSVEGKIIFAIKETVDFEYIGLSGCSLHHQTLADGIVRRITEIAVPWWSKRTNRSKQVSRGVQRGR